MKDHFHQNFSLNGKEFTSSSELLKYSETIGESIFSFLSKWFDTNDFVIVQTSGSTGRPKQIRLKKAHMVNSALATGAYFKLPKKTSALVCLSTDYIAGKMMLVRALVLGWHLDIIEPTSHPLNGIDKTYDFCAMVPLQLYNSIDKLDRVNKIIVGGGVVSKDLRQKISTLKTQIFATYGMTETITHIAVKRMNNFCHTELDSAPHYHTLPNIKISINERRCMVVNAPKISDHQIYTNDLVELISDTEFKWLGRYDTIINSGGIKLIPEQLEEKLAAIIDYRFFVGSLSDAALGEKLILIVESDQEDNTILNKIRNLNTISKFEIPKEIYFVKKFVETETKKVNRNMTIKLI